MIQTSSFHYFKALDVLYMKWFIKLCIKKLRHATDFVQIGHKYCFKLLKDLKILYSYSYTMVR